MIPTEETLEVSGQSAKNGLNVLFILPEYYPHSGGGISTYYLHYIKCIKQYTSSIKVMVGSAYTQDAETIRHEGVEIEYLDPVLFKKYIQKFKKFSYAPEYMKAISASWAMYEQSNQGKGFDIVECTDFGLGFIPWIMQSNLATIVRLHGSSGQIELFHPAQLESIFGDLCRQTELLLLNNADLLVTHSKANFQYWKNLIPNAKIELIAPIFYTTDFEPISLAKKDQSGIVCGRIQEWKGPDILCEAIAGDQDLNHIKIKWYGRDTSYDSNLSKSAQLAKIYPMIWGKNIIPKRPVAYSELTALQHIAKYAVIPSTWDMYNFTCLEYMSVGTIVICSSGAGVSELVENGINGFTYANDDAKALASRIKEVLDLDEKAYQQMATNAFQKLNADLSPEKLAKVNLQAYQTVINASTPKNSNSFINALYQPSDINFDIEHILNKQPLKLLIKYLLKRLRKKTRLG